MSDQPIIIKKKKAGHGGGHHGGSWKVAYADFVTAMMAFFMVLWIMGLSEETKAQIAGYFNDPMGFMKNEPRSRSIITLPGSPAATPSHKGKQADPSILEDAQIQRMKKDLVKTMSQDTSLKKLMKDVVITITPEGLLIELVENGGTAFFDLGQSSLRPEAQRLVARISPVLAQYGRKMRIEGHTDAKPYAGSVYTNWELSTDRALSLRQALSRDGVADSQFLGVMGFGPTRLKRPDKPFDMSNRRVTILLPKTYKANDQQALPRDAIDSQMGGIGDSPVDLRPESPKIADTKTK